MNNAEQQKQAEHFVRALFGSITPDIVILPSTTSDAYDNEEDHVRALNFHKALAELKEMAKFYDLEVKVKNA